MIILESYENIFYKKLSGNIGAQRRTALQWMII